jgi:hypothetical protein
MGGSKSDLVVSGQDRREVSSWNVEERKHGSQGRVRFDLFARDVGFAWAASVRKEVLG